MDLSQIKDLLALGFETRSLEVKTAGSSQDEGFFPKVIRAMLALTNGKDGGHILIGVHNADMSIVEEFPDAAWETWSSADNWADKVGQYVDPPIDFSLSRIEENGERVVHIRVQPFDHMPVVCKRGTAMGKNGKQTLRQGGLYSRSKKKMAESAEIATAVDMHALLEIALEKRLLRHRRLVAVEASSTPTLEAREQEMVKHLLTKYQFLSKEVCTRGYWIISFAPKFLVPQEPFNYIKLGELIWNSQVTRGGANFPSFNFNDEIREDKHIEYKADFAYHREVWAFCTDGSFYFVGGLNDDWRDRNVWASVSEQWQHGTRLNVYDVVRRYAETFEFASRIAQLQPDAESFEMKISLNNIGSRELEIAEWRKTMSRALNISTWSRTITISSSDLKLNASERGLEQAKELLQRAHFDVDIGVLKDILNESRFGR